jgi:hypothetical protein
MLEIGRGDTGGEFFPFLVIVGEVCLFQQSQSLLDFRNFV